MAGSAGQVFTPINNNKWVTGGPYTGRVQTFRLNGEGQIWTNQLVADTSAPPATVAYKMEIFDETGTPRGYIPVYATI